MYVTEREFDKNFKMMSILVVPYLALLVSLGFSSSSSSSSAFLLPTTRRHPQCKKHQSHAHHRHHRNLHGGPCFIRLYSSSMDSSATTTSNHNYYIDIQEGAPRDIGTMDEWATACGVQRVDGWQLTLTDGNGDIYGTGLDYDVSVLTKEDLPANSPVLFVPNQMILSSHQARQELGGEHMEAAESLLKSLNALDQIRHFYLVLKILLEYEQGDASPWYPWLNAMPRHFNNGASMTSFCYECLPPLAAELAMKERANLRALTAAIFKVPFLSHETKSNKELCTWVFQIVYTRSFDEKQNNGRAAIAANNSGSDENDIDVESLGDLRIAPMADMFNHGTNAQVVLTYDEEGNCLAQTVQDVPAGSPLTLTYDDPSNPSFLFARYGFLDETSPATFCKLILPHVNKDLLDLGYAYNRMLFYKDTGYASEEVFDVFLYQILASSNVAARRAFIKAHQEADVETKQSIHEHYYPETAAKLQNHIDSFLQTLDNLAAKFEGQDIHEHPRLPLIWKHNEFVRNTFLAVRERYF